LVWSTPTADLKPDPPVRCAAAVSATNHQHEQDHHYPIGIGRITHTTAVRKTLPTEEMVQDDGDDDNNNFKKASVRHAEKRRTASCRFADRVAEISVQHYRAHVPQHHQTLTCLSTIVAHSMTDDTLMVLGMVRFPFFL
jgi:hypothetical protein